MGKKIYKGIVLGAMAFALLTVLLLGVTAAALPREIVIESKDALPSYPCVALCDMSRAGGETEGEEICSVSAKLFGVIQVKRIDVKEKASRSLIVGGEAFGVKILTDGVVVSGFSQFASCGKSVCPAKEAGIRVNDVLLSVNGVPVRSASQVASLLEAAGASATVVCRHGEETKEITLSLAKADEDGKQKAGLLLRDTASGIGTITFIDPKTGSFGALGHGICESTTGELTPLQRGVVTDVKIHSIIKGSSGTPGELRGYLYGEKKGSVLYNTATGVYGVLTSYKQKEMLPVASSDEVKEGKATIRCALDGEEVKEYEIEIKSINRQSETKSFVVCVTDEALLAKTGGIIQGMSGSPIIQNGKLVGAVTHVMINDPTTGYGIFIENMLNAANISMAKAS